MKRYAENLPTDSQESLFSTRLEIRAESLPSGRLRYLSETRRVRRATPRGLLHSTARDQPHRLSSRRRGGWRQRGLGRSLKDMDTLIGDNEIANLARRKSERRRQDDRRHDGGGCSA